LDARIDQAKRSGTRDVLEAAGFKNLDTPEGVEKAKTDMAALLQFALAQQAEKMTADEKVQKQLKDLTDERDAARKTLQTEQDAHKQAVARFETLQRTIALTKAASGAHHPDDIMTWAQANQPDELAKVLKNDGTPDEAQAKKIVEACKQARPDWFTVTPGVPSNAGGRPLPGDPTKLEKGRELARANLRRGI
jgi:hypothetical protein